MVKDFNLFKNSTQSRNFKSINEEYYYSDGNKSSWWRRANKSWNENEKISRKETKDDPEKYKDLIKEIQQFLDLHPHGVWDNDTAKGIEYYKKKYEKYDWESGKDGEVICKSFYKFFIYNSSEENNYFPAVFLEVIQRPRIIQMAYKNFGDQHINNWFTIYSETMIKNNWFIKISNRNWQRVNIIDDEDLWKDNDDPVHSRIVGELKGGTWQQGECFFETFGLQKDQEYIDLINNNASPPRQLYYRMMGVLKYVKAMDKDKMRKLMKRD
jgi:hypothetical protein